MQVQVEKSNLNQLPQLTTAEVEEKISRGQVNLTEDDLLKSDATIIKENTLTVFNFLNLALAVMVFLVGSPKNALFFLVVIINTCIGIYQELKAKHTIDQLSVLAKNQAQVLRDQEIKEIPQTEIVLGDTLYIQNGDQIPVDGKILTSQGLEIDESLLTGEADRIQKKVGEDVFSGSFVTAGEGYFQATAVGADNFAQKLTQAAKNNSTSPSALLKILKRMIMILTILIIPLGSGMMYAQYLSTDSIKQAVLGTVAALVSMIPEGLMLLTSVAFAVGAANLARRKVLVQSLPSIETLARVDTICLDKTGTITDGSLTFQQALLHSLDKNSFDKIMGALMAHLADKNATANALREHFSEGTAWQAEKIVPFSSSRKWSGVSFKEQGSFVIGAPEFVFTKVPTAVTVDSKNYMEAGYRVLVLAKYPQILSEELRAEPELLALLIISDNLRDNAQATFSYFAEQDVTLKVISGDHPLTVARIAEQAGIAGAKNYVDMSQVATSDYKKLVTENTVFGRVSPQQKQALIQALQENKHTVCMTGDGVNDVLALRQADIGVAMANGSSAARAAAEVILLESDFAAMKNVLNEGRRVINNIERVASMYLVKTIYSLLLALIFMLLATPYPFQPVQLTPLNALTVGLPSFILALKPSYERIKGDFLNNILRVSLPGALTVVACVLLLQLAGDLFSLPFIETSSMSVFLTGCVGLFVLYQVSLPLDKKKGGLLLACSLGYLICFLFLRNFFNYDQLLDRNLFFIIPVGIGGYFLFQKLSDGMALVVNWRIKRQK